MNFTDTPICKSRSNCFQCRNQERFRKQMESQYGSWECPEGFPIGAKLEDLPEKSQEAHKRMAEARKRREEQQKELSAALDELEMIIPAEGLHIVTKIRGIVAPNTKSPEKCVHGKKKIGQVDQECCGGKIEKVDAYSCSKHTITTSRKCSTCGDFSIEKTQ